MKTYPYVITRVVHQHYTLNTNMEMGEEWYLRFIDNWARRPKLYKTITVNGEVMGLAEIRGKLLIMGLL